MASAETKTVIVLTLTEDEAEKLKNKLYEDYGDGGDDQDVVDNIYAALDLII